MLKHQKSTEAEAMYKKLIYICVCAYVCVYIYIYSFFWKHENFFI